MQNESGNYAGRRTLITDSIDRLIEYIEEYSDEEADPFSQIKQYKRVEQIGYGGFGSVFKYHNACLDMDFAVKVYSPIFVSSDEQREGERRFFREAKMLFQLNHMNIVKIYDAGRISEGPFIRMEYIEGYDLNGLQKKYGMLSFEYSVKVIKPILNGLKYAHGKGIIHRALKPSNVVFSTKEKIFKIIDFGVSAFLDAENNTKLTKTGEAVAGGAFIDPLLQENPKLRDCRSDIYSIGAIWYWLLCGRAPHGSDMRTYLSNAVPDLSDRQINIVMKCLAGNLEDRYGLQDDPMGLYSDYESFKKHFVRYWKNALDISRADLDEVRDIFDDVLSTQESCKNRAVTSVFFENGKALTIEDCLEAIYEVLKIA